MKYEEALARWGAEQLKNSYSYRDKRNLVVALDTVVVSFNFDKGYACCGGRDPDCYCSYAESPKAEVIIAAGSEKHGSLYHTIDISDFDFATVLKEIVAIADGVVTDG